jgi:D-3-phosphoglycerate dehydrogenase / 2-oxoglutarate reductase
MTTVLISAPYIIPVLDRFQPILESYGLSLIVAPVSERLEEGELMRYAGQVDGVICGDDCFSSQVLDAYSPRLKVISKWGTGIDSIDREAATRLGIIVYNTPNAFTLPVADTVMGYILAFARRQPWMDRSMKAGLWDKVPCRSLSECSLGVVGVGKCGKAVLRRARAFGMELLGNDIVEIAPDFLVENGVEILPLENLLAQADFVSLNCDLNPSSFHLMNHHTLELMKKSAVLINTARGQVVAERDLVAALQANKIAGAALDVYEQEPLPADSPLLSMDNILLAPHNANSSPTAWERVHNNTIQNLLHGLGLLEKSAREAREGIDQRNGSRADCV